MMAQTLPSYFSSISCAFTTMVKVLFYMKAGSEKSNGSGANFKMLRIFEIGF
jgi:hypothetical protein